MSNIIPLCKAELSGRYRLQVHRDGELRHDTGWLDNLITDAGLEALGENKAIALYCMVGTGNAAPANSDTVLQAQIASKDGSVSVSSSYGGNVVTTGDRYGWQTRDYSFPQGAVVGNVAEVGIGWNSTAVFSRALVSPAVSIVALDQLTVLYELRMYLPTVDVTGTVTIGATSYGYAIRPIYADSGTASTLTFGWGVGLLQLGASARTWCNFNSFGGFYGGNSWGTPAVLQAVSDTAIRQTLGGTASPTTTNCFPSSISNAAYVAASLEGQFTQSFAVAHSNISGGTRAFIFHSMFGTYQMILDDVILKDNTKTMTITYKVTWARR